MRLAASRVTISGDSAASALPSTATSPAKMNSASVLVWCDWVLAVVWFVVVFVFCFRSPLYWKLGDVPGYALTEQTALGLAARQAREAAAQAQRA